MARAAFLSYFVLKISTSKSHLPSDNTRCNAELLVHMHIPKTGGSSFRVYFEREPLRKKLCCKHPHFCEKYDTTLSQYECGQCNVASGEWRFSHVQKYMRQKTTNVKLITMIRNPLRHALSALDHRMRVAQKCRANCKQSTFNGTSMERMLDEMDANPSSHGVYGDLRNSQSEWALPASMGTEHPMVTDIRSFLEKEYFFVGVTDYYWHSMCALQYKLGTFTAERCNCSTAPRGKYGEILFANVTENAHKRAPGSSFIKASDIARISNRLHRDELLYAAAIFFLREALRQIELAVAHIDLMSCW